MTGHYLSLPDPPGGTRLQLIAARLRGDWDEVDRILAPQPTHTPTNHNPAFFIAEPTTAEQENIVSTKQISADPEVPIYQHEDGSLISAEAALEASDTAFEGNTDFRERDEIGEARAVIERYCDILPSGEPGLPHLVKYGSLQATLSDEGEMEPPFLVRHIARSTGWALDKAYHQLVDGWIVSCQLNQQLKAERLVGGQAISLDLVPEGDFPQDRGHPLAPKVVIVEIPKSVKVTAPLNFPNEQEYMAVWFVPNRRCETRTNKSTGEVVKGFDGEPIVDIIPLDRDGEVRQAASNGRMYCDDRWLAGYVGVVAWFATYTEAMDAHRELLQAVRRIARPPKTAEIPDAMREQLLSQYEEDDEAFLAWQAKQAAMPSAPPLNPFR